MLRSDARAMAREAWWVARCVGKGEWAPLSNGDVEDLAARLSTRSYEPGEQLFAQGQPPDGVYIVREGRVELVWRGSMRRRLIVQILHPGDIEGDICTIMGAPPPYSARAIDLVEALVISTADLESLLATRPQVSRRWLSSVAARLMSAERRILQLAGRDLKTQLATLLLDEERDDSVALPQESLASLLGVRRPSLNKVLKDLERAGFVKLSYGCVDIADRRGLARAAGRAAD